ncbi:MAG: bacillithiol biosynthesis cysteine-adding enzyme BshC [Flavobacteriaceae bacterium]
MSASGIPFRKTGYFSSLICDYLDEVPHLKPFYNRFPNLENFKLQIEEKQKSEQTNAAHRSTLVSVLQDQYKNVETSAETLINIAYLKNETTFTITTGHQLNLFTGPLYFLYKIISTINLSKALKETYPEYHFVPVYWMATEDHDFDEINYFNFKGKKIQWNTNAQGAVGRLSTRGLAAVYDLFSMELGHTEIAKVLKNIFKTAYLEHDNLANATRYLANELFKDSGLVIIDADSKRLKKLFVPFIEAELLKQTAFKAVTETNNQINALAGGQYNIQVTPREINLFYLAENLRERIVLENGVYKVLNTKTHFTQAEILKEVNARPERFSPNVIMRPLYQEVVLPNLCYIGGGGEIAYWLQLKAFFNQVEVPFPVLLLRNSVLLQSEKQGEKLKKLNISETDIFLKRNAFINKKVREISNIDIDFSPQILHLKQQFEHLHALADQTDKSFLGAVKAQEAKQIKGLKNLEKRLLKAQKQKLKDQVSRMTELQNQLFPNQGLQERNANFSEFYLEYGKRLTTSLIEGLDPLCGAFIVVEI